MSNEWPTTRSPQSYDDDDDDDNAIIVIGNMSSCVREFVMLFVGCKL